MILQNLDDLRAGFPGTELVAYLDLGTGTVLGKSSVVIQPQERLDALCADAGSLLGGADGPRTEAVRLSPGDVTVLARAPEEHSEVLCLVCAPDVDVDAARAAVQGALGFETDGA